MIFFPFGLVAVASLLSLFTVSTNKVEALMSPFGPITFIVLTILLFIFSPLSAHGKKYLRILLFTAGTIVGIITIYGQLGIAKTPPDTTTLGFLSICITIILFDIKHIINKSEDTATIALSILSLLIMITGLGISLWYIVPKFSSLILPVSLGWTVLQKSLTLSGVGAENFLTAYTQHKPAWVASSPLWNIRFPVSSNFLFHISTIYGVIGGIASLSFLWILATPVKLVALLALLLLPPSLPILIATAITLLITDTKAHSYKKRPLLLWIVLTALAITGGFFAIRYLQGERAVKNALSYAKNNKGTETYTVMQKAIHANPFASSYRIVYSQTSLAIANSVATEDQSLASELIAQSVTQAKLAVTLNPLNILAWENLAATYETIVPVAQGADVWAQTAYAQAIILDPTNPILAIKFGNILVRQKKYDDAINAFKKAIELRPQYANAYYNLGNAYRASGDTIQAKEALTQAMHMIPQDSPDYQKVKTEIDLLE